ncbi:MAG: 16S rRNA (cytidine(1402)-2'-O)-methyltransferase [Endozoicomonadaceae bacterium]|nr:16S rRNA (cytidine(1402)-2'-O)-methyltransferase [Endozoicomonadaceae bacterium]
MNDACLYSDACLYIVATPIGNLEDITSRAVKILQSVDVIAAEDTRHTARLLNHLGIRKPMLACHEHNERDRSAQIIAKMAVGESVALVSDAGTPLISDPGYFLVASVREAGYRVAPIPGACALIAALSVSGLPSDRFFFEGFLPAKSVARRKRFQALSGFEHTWIVYESSHRIEESLSDMAEVLGVERGIVIARELTKLFETVLAGTVGECLERLQSDANQKKGEFVVLVRGAQPLSALDGIDESAARVMGVLMEELSLKQASHLTARISGGKKKALYDYGLSLKRKESE